MWLLFEKVPFLTSYKQGKINDSAALFALESFGNNKYLEYLSCWRRYYLKVYGIFDSEWRWNKVECDPDSSNPETRSNHITKEGKTQLSYQRIVKDRGMEKKKVLPGKDESSFWNSNR